MFASLLAAKESDVLVLTELAPLYSMTSALALNTAISVRNIPTDGRGMNALSRYLEKPGAHDLELLKQADAVVTIGKLWRESRLYVAARAQNIRVVNIDASEPFSATLPGVSLIREPSPHPPWNLAREMTAQPPSVYCWLSPTNGVRMAEIIAQDLMRLSPADSETIAENLLTYRRMLLGLKAEYEARFAELTDLSLFVLSPDFVYLTDDLGLFVEGAFVKQDIEWSEHDLRSFRDYLRARDIAVVVHEWEPSAPIRQAIEAAGARLVVLATAEEGAVQAGGLARDGYIQTLRANLESIYQAGKKAAQ